MLLKRQHFALCLLPQLGETIYTKYTGFNGDTDPSSYMFYDPVEQCNKSKAPCITSFKYCSHIGDDWGFVNYRCPDNAQEDTSWISGGLRDGVIWAAESSDPLAIYTDAIYTLKWQNTNPEYPTTVTWRPYLGGRGMYLYKIIDAGETEFSFSFDNITDVMRAERLPTLEDGSEPDHNITSAIIDLAKESHLWFFTVGQPEDPNVSQNFTYPYLGSGAENVSDVSTRFLLTSRLSTILAFTQQGARGYFDQETSDLKKTWGIGVGVGVGVGMPLVAGIMFFLGKRNGRRTSARKHAD